MLRRARGSFSGVLAIPYGPHEQSARLTPRELDAQDQVLRLGSTGVVVPAASAFARSLDSSGNRTSVIVESRTGGHVNQTTAYGYNGVGDVTSATDPNGDVTTSTWDAARRLATTTLPVATGGLVTTNGYDADGRLLQVQQSANGSVLRTTQATYTPSGKPATVTDANGNVGLFAYDLLDRQVSATDAMGRVTVQSYDVLSRPWQTFNLAIQPAVLLTRTYTPDGLPAGLTDAKGSNKRRKVKEGESDTLLQKHTVIAAGGDLGVDELFARASRDA